jgi:hypothetical protein
MKSLLTCAELEALIVISLLKRSSAACDAREGRARELADSIALHEIWS